MKVKKNGAAGEELKNARRCVISVKNKIKDRTRHAWTELIVLYTM